MKRDCISLKMSVFSPQHYHYTLMYSVLKCIDVIECLKDYKMILVKPTKKEMVDLSKANYLGSNVPFCLYYNYCCIGRGILNRNQL